MPAARLLLLPAFLLISACASHPRLDPFRSDGCSMWPDRKWTGGKSYCSCCVVHDVAYWQGGSDAERLAADDSLRACVARKTGDTAYADAVWAGVRAGGPGWAPTWYRWGYGWTYNAKAQPDSIRDAEVRRRGGADVAKAAHEACGDGEPSPR